MTLPEGTLNLIIEGFDVEDSVPCKYELDGNDIIRVRPPVTLNSNVSGQGVIELVDKSGMLIGALGGKIKRHELVEICGLKAVPRLVLK